jgi:branched-chain amino acid transport system permease protein
MSKLLHQPLVRRFARFLMVAAVIEVMTGPPGSTQTPLAGIDGSFANRESFFGLFPAPRWTIFLVLVAIIFGLSTLWKANSKAIKSSYAKAMTAPRALTQRKQVRWTFLAALLVFAIFLPHLETNPYWQAQMTEEIGVFVLLALGLNVVVGFAGLLDLGFVAFYAIGAYTTAWVTGALPTPFLFHHPLNPFVSIPIAILFVMVAGVLLGIPTLRLRGDYLAIVTLGFGEIVTIFANNLYGITGGSFGSGGSTGKVSIPHFSIHLGPIHYVWTLSPVPYYYLALVFVVVFIIVFTLLEHSRIGRSWTAIREDEVAAESVGINPLKYKVMAFAIGAASAGFAGVITAGQSNFVNPANFTLQVSINVLVLVIFGGMGSIAGVVFGAILIQTISAYLIHSQPFGYQSSDLYMYIGALLVVMMIFRPAGLIPSRRRRREIGLAEEGEGHMDEVLTGDNT